MSGVVVPKMNRSISAGSTPAASIALWQASIASVPVVWSSSAIRRSQIPVLLPDPLIAGIHDLFQIMIGDNFVGQVTSRPDDF